jgi:Ser/Thr protein kinase RdoA (MazF antagonist)
MKIDPKILSQAAQFYGIKISDLRVLGGMDGIKISDLRVLGGMEGMALEYKQDNIPYVLKITPKSKDNPDELEILEEKLGFINYLAENGVRVAKPIPSPSGQWVEVVESDELIYLVNAMIKADGRHVELYNLKHRKSSFFQNWGRVTGQMHALAKKYPFWQKKSVEGNPPTKITDWRDEHAFFRGWCQSDDVREKWIKLGDEIEKLPQTRDGFGLIHNDLHPWNFLVDTHGQITVIDFDVCAYHFFIKDIAIALFFANWNGKPTKGQPKGNYLTDFFRKFMTGYSVENDMDSFWFTQLPSFLKHHQILLFTVFTDEWKKPNKWQADTLRKWKHQILNDIPVVSIQF